MRGVHDSHVLHVAIDLVDQLLVIDSRTRLVLLECPEQAAEEAHDEADVALNIGHVYFEAFQEELARLNVAFLLQV